MHTAHRLNRRTVIANGLRAIAGAATLGLTGTATCAVQTRDDAPTGAQSLKAHAAARGLLTGSAVNVHALQTDASYRQSLIDQCNLLVGENCMKFGPLRPTPDTYNFADADALLTFAQSHGIPLRGHNFVWHEQLPAWFAATATKDNARRLLTDHIQAVAGRYKGKIHSWDVVNEAIWLPDGRPDGLRSSSPWFQLLGPEYLELAFRTARQTDPTALLTYNDYGFETDEAEDTAKRAAVLALLRRLKAANVPLDALGLQSHLRAGGSSTFTRAAAELAQAARQLGLQVFVTEMDVKDDGVASDQIAARDQAVAATYSHYLGALLRSPDLKAVLTWGIADNRTWLNQGTRFRPDHPTRDQRPLPFDAEYLAKSAFYSIRDAFDAAASRSLG